LIAKLAFTMLMLGSKLSLTHCKRDSYCTAAQLPVDIAEKF
jgi:hypothetical protein